MAEVQLYLHHKVSSEKYQNKTSQELRMLSSVTINCQITKIVMISGSQLSVLLSVSQMSQVSGLSLLLLSIIVTIVVNVIIFIIVNNYFFFKRWLKLSKIVKLVRSSFFITLNVSKVTCPWVHSVMSKSHTVSCKVTYWAVLDS